MRSTIVLALLVASATTAAAATPIKVVTYNTHHGGTAVSPPSTESEMDTIAAANPDVVVLQEAYSSQLATYVNGLNSRMTAWHGSYAKHCKTGSEPNCTTYAIYLVGRPRNPKLAHFRLQGGPPDAKTCRGTCGPSDHAAGQPERAKNRFPFGVLQRRARRRAQT
jgi:hypothetical protein